MAEREAILCYRSDQHTLPLALLNPVFGNFGLHFTNKSPAELSHILVCLELSHAMQPLMMGAGGRQQDFGELLGAYLTPNLPDGIHLSYQKGGHSIVSMRLQGRASPCSPWRVLLACK